MKKLFLTLGLASLFMVACNNTPKQEEAVAEPAEEQTEVVEEKQECPMHALKDEYAKWDEMTDEAKAELNAKAAEYRKQIADAEAAMAATWNPAMKQRLQERIDATRAKLAAVEAQL